ncbi:MAG: hypothetical protein U0325_01655 [Polyangiales bacterium]
MTRTEGAAHALAVVALVAVHLAAGSAPGHRALPYLLAHAMLFAASLLAGRAMRDDNAGVATLRRVLAVGVAVRVALIPVAPFTTTDVGATSGMARCSSPARIPTR